MSPKISFRIQARAESQPRRQASGPTTSRVNQPPRPLFMLTAAGTLLGLIACGQFGTIQIDWVAEGNGKTTPRLVGLESGSEESAQSDSDERSGRRLFKLEDGKFTEIEVEEPSVSEREKRDADAFEEVWSRDFAEMPQSEWFAASETPRGELPPSAALWGLRVGAVYRHSLTGSRGVVIGWDYRPRAPRKWLTANLPGQRSARDRLRRLYAPHYSVLEETPAGAFMQRYVVALCREDDPRPCLEVESPAKPLSHPELAKYFDGLDLARGYLPNAALRERYPHDAAPGPAGGPAHHRGRPGESEAAEEELPGDRWSIKSVNPRTNKWTVNTGGGEEEFDVASVKKGLRERLEVDTRTDEEQERARLEWLMYYILSDDWDGAASMAVGEDEWEFIMEAMR